MNNMTEKLVKDGREGLRTQMHLTHYHYRKLSHGFRPCLLYHQGQFRRICRFQWHSTRKLLPAPNWLLASHLQEALPRSYQD